MPVEGVSTFGERLQTYKDSHPVKRRGSTAKKRAPATLKWPHKTPTGQDLAQAGFYFHPSSSSPDNVRCFSCEVNLDGWEAEDDPVLEHYAHRSDCAWATCRYVKRKFEKQDFIQEDPMSEVYANARKTTFEGWPHESKRGWKCKIEKMVEAGWHFDPSPDMEDGVTCAYCSTELGGWERKDDPFEEHLKRGTNCPFFALCDRFASSRPAKPKRARTSKASRASTQSTVSAINDQVTIADLDTSRDITDVANDDTVLSTVTTISKPTKTKRKVTSKSAKAKAQKEAPLGESALMQNEESDLGLSTMSQPARKQRTRKKATATDESMMEASDLGVSTSKPKRKARTKNNDIDASETPTDAVEVSTTKPVRQTRRKASKQITSQTETHNIEPEVKSKEMASSQEHQAAMEHFAEPAMIASVPKMGKKRTNDSNEKQESVANIIAVPTSTTAPSKKINKPTKGVKRTSDGAIKNQAPQIRMSALDKLDSSVMVLDEVPLIFEDSPDKSVKRTKKHSSIREPLKELEPAAVQRVSEASMLRSSNMHEANSSTPRMTPEPASAGESPEPPTPTPARQSLSVVKRASMMRQGMRPSATPLPSKSSNDAGEVNTPASSPQSSDAENKPPSSRPNVKGLQLKAISPLRNQLHRTPMLSPSKRSNVVSRIQTEHRWTPADLDMVFQPYSPVKCAQANDKENFIVPVSSALDMTNLNASDLALTLKAVRATITEDERKMTVEQWLKYTGIKASEKLRTECESMVTLFEREGAKAMRVLEAIKVSR